MALFRWHGAISIGGIHFVGGQQALVAIAISIDRGFYIEIIPVRLNFKPGVKTQYQLLLRIHLAQIKAAAKEVV